MDQSKSQKPSIAASLLAQRGAPFTPKEVKSEGSKSILEGLRKEKSLAQKIITLRKAPKAAPELSLDDLLKEEEEELDLLDLKEEEEPAEDESKMSMVRAILSRMKKKA